MACLNDIRAPQRAVIAFPGRRETIGDRRCCDRPDLVSAWARDPAGRPVRRWRLQPHTHH